MKIKAAYKRVCVCQEEHKNHVQVDSIELKNHELDSLDGFYCIHCNSFWREP